MSGAVVEAPADRLAPKEDISSVVGDRPLVHKRFMKLDENYVAMVLRWHLYRRWKRSAPPRRAVLDFRRALRQVPAGALAIDCGANVGDVTDLMLKDGLRVIAFEPDPLALRQLNRRFGANPNVTIIPKAVGASDRKAAFYQHVEAVKGDIALTISSSLMERPDHLADQAATVDVVDIVAFLSSLDERPAIVKIDIEGAEAEVLEALLDSGAHRRIGAIFVETHDRISPEIAARLDAIRSRIARENIGNVDLNWP